MENYKDKISKTPISKRPTGNVNKVSDKLGDVIGTSSERLRENLKKGQITY